MLINYMYKNEKEKLETPFRLVAPFRKDSLAIVVLARYFIKKPKDFLSFDPSKEKETIQKITVKDIVDLDTVDIRKIINTCSYGGDKLDNEDIKKFRLAMVKVQKTFKLLGFDEKSSEFMRVMFYPKTDKDMAVYICQNWPISPNAAEEYVKTAKVLKMDLKNLTL